MRGQGEGWLPSSQDRGDLAPHTPVGFVPSGPTQEPVPILARRRAAGEVRGSLAEGCRRFREHPGEVPILPALVEHRRDGGDEARPRGGEQHRDKPPQDTVLREFGVLFTLRPLPPRRLFGFGWVFAKKPFNRILAWPKPALGQPLLSAPCARPRGHPDTLQDPGRGWMPGPFVG